jgi:hypothetical protein
MSSSGVLYNIMLKLTVSTRVLEQRKETFLLIGVSCDLAGYKLKFQTDYFLQFHDILQRPFL